MKLICRYCSTQFEEDELLSYSRFPLIADTVKDDDHGLKSKWYRYSIVICPECSWIQQASEPDLSLIYRKFKNERLGDIWREHHKALKEFIGSYLTVISGNRVAEIGGGDLELAHVLKSEFPNIELLVYENSPPKNVDTKSLSLERKLWEDANVEHPFNLIYSSHVIEHIPDIRVHITKIKNNLEKGGYFIVSLPDFKYWIEKLYLNAFNQEHLVYPFITDIIDACACCGLSVDKIFRFQNHSVFLAFRNSEEKSMTGEQKSTYFSAKRRLVIKFKQHLSRINNFLEQKCAGKKTYLFGANSSTQVLLSLPAMKEISVEAILDNSELKQGQFLAGTGIAVYGPSILREIDSYQGAVVVLFMGAYTSEIKKQIREINNELEILSPSDF